MSEVHQTASLSLSRASQTTRGLVAVFHFFIAAILVGAILVDWVTVRPSGDDLFMLEVLSAIGVPFALLYSVTGWGILGWRNWSRISSLVLNWLNVIAAVWSVVRQRINPTSAISVLLSCLVLWWLSTPEVKFQFLNRSRTE